MQSAEPPLGAMLSKALQCQQGFGDVPHGLKCDADMPASLDGRWLMRRAGGEHQNALRVARIFGWMLGWVRGWNWAETRMKPGAVAEAVSPSVELQAGAC